MGKDTWTSPDDYDRALVPISVHTHIDQRTTYDRVDSALEILLEGGYTAAEAKAAQLAGTDANTELMRVMEIMRKHNLSPEAGAEVLNNLFQIKDGHW
jgi:hypothetical protein